MKGYHQYMDRQQVSAALHSRLLALEQTVPVPKPKPRRVRWQSVALLAACLCLVLGLSWRGFVGLSSTGAGDAAAAGDTTAESSQAPETSQMAEGTGDTNGGPAVQDSVPEAEEAGQAQEAVPESGLPQTEGAAAEDTGEEERFSLPNWLPEDYVLTQSQTWEDGSKLRVTWENSQGEGITLTYETVPQESDWPTYPWAEANWDTLAQIAPQDGLWGFCLQGQDLWLECTTTGDPQTLWQVVQSIPQP